MIWIAVSLTLSLSFAWLVHRTFVGIDGVRRKTAIGMLLAGAALALPTRLLIAYALDSLGWSLRTSSTTSPLVAWLSATLVAAPIEHLVLAVVVWPLYRVHRLERQGTAISAAALAAAGFGSVASVLLVSNERTIAGLLLGLGTFASRLFGAGVWASFLATSRVRFKPWIPVAWACGVLIDGFVRHLLEGRGTGFRVVSVPPLLAMFVIAAVTVRKLGGSRESAVFGHAYRLGIGVDAPGLETVRAAFQHAHRPALVHWIVGGALVNFGASLVALALGVFVAHFFGIDLSRVDEFDANAAAPLVVLGLHVLLSFPLAGFLTAKASAADSLFEPAVSALISIVALTVLLSRSAPVTLVLGLALSPLAFGLACTGAWFGIERRPSS